MPRFISLKTATIPTIPGDAWMKFRSLFRFLPCLVLIAACQTSSRNPMEQKQQSTDAQGGAQAGAMRDAHSFSNPEQIRVRHVELDLEVLFSRKVLKGSATLTPERAAPADSLKLDTRDLKIPGAESSADGANFSKAEFALGEADGILGAPLTIRLPAQAANVRIEYESSPGASGVQWLEPAQTAGKKHPYVFTQSQAIHARSWITSVFQGFRQLAR
jgi:leukotriene-A4 hydrolase